MSSLDKLLKAFDSVRVTATQSGSSKPKKNAQEPSSSSLNEEEKRNNLEQPKTMAYYASSLSQQGQNLLRKEHALTSRDKLALCQSVSESVISGTKLGSDSQKLISIGIETLIVLIDDENPDVRMNADESLNRVIRSLSDNHMGKIQLELFKEIKKNGSVRCLRAALTRFGILCYHIRPQKCRAYVQNLLPYLTKIARRPEENLQETLTQCLEKVLPVLGHFTNDNEVRSLLKAFLPNVTHHSASLRRSATSSVVFLCQHSRKPNFFFLWVLDSILQTLVPLQEDAVPSHVIGSLLLIRSITPHLDKMISSHKKSTTFSLDQALQVYELCLHYTASEDHNVVIASLEALQALLQNLCGPLLAALTAPEGISRSRVVGDKSHQLGSRTPSEASICVPVTNEDCIEAEEERMPLEKTPDDPLGGTDPVPAPRLVSESEGTYLEPQEEELFPTDEADSRSSSVYADIEIGQVSDSGGLLLGRSHLDIDDKTKTSRSKKKKFTFTSQNSVTESSKTENSTDNRVSKTGRNH